jgi:hypothetical protein
MTVPTKYAFDPELAAVAEFPELDSSDVAAACSPAPSTALP